MRVVVGPLHVTGRNTDAGHAKLLPLVTREDLGVAWEKTDRVDALKKALS